MKIAVLLSAGIHPVSRRPVLPRGEAQAIALARALSSDVVGVHAGPDVAGVSQALGHGLARLLHAEIPQNADPLPSLLSVLRTLEPDLILAGRRAEGGEESGLLPYMVAAGLGIEIVADAVAIDAENGVLAVDGALPRGVRRRIRTACPALATVHPAAPAARAYAFAQERRGMIEHVPGVTGTTAAPPVEERPARARPRLIGGGIAGSAAERLRAATETGTAGGEVLVDPEPEAAAWAILAHLRKVGVLRP